MYGIPRFSVTQSVMTNLLTGIVIVTGLVSAYLLPRELFPMVSTDFVTVVTIYPRASADEVEKTITVLIEEEISDVRGIKTLRSTTVEGRSVVVLEVDPDIESSSKVERDVENEIDKILTDLPRDAEEPVVREFVFDFPIINVSVSGAASEKELKLVAEGIQDHLKRVPGISDVSISGEREEELWAEIDPNRLYGYGLTLEDVRLAIQMGGIDLAGGVARATGREFIVRTKMLYNDPEDLRRVVLKTDGAGGRVRIADIADVRDTFEEAVVIGRAEGERCINLEVKQRPGGDSIRLVDAVKATLRDEIEPTLPYGVRVGLNRDISFMVRERLELLTSNGLMGLVLCLLLLRMFLNSRMALMTALGIPFALMATLALMSFTDISLNMISMFALIMVLGMLVDDGIVVCENVYRYRQMGIDPITASIKGAGEVFWSVVGAVSTTVAAFLPILYMTGIMGKFCRPIPIVISIALVASLFEALMVLPVHLAEWGKPRDWTRLTRFNGPFLKAYHKGGLGRISQSPALLRPLLYPVSLFLTVVFAVAFPLLQSLVLFMRGAQWVGRTFDSSAVSPNQWFPRFMRIYYRTLNRCLRNRYAILVALLGIIGVVGISLGIDSTPVDPTPRVVYPALVLAGVLVCLATFVLCLHNRLFHVVVPIMVVVGGFAFYTIEHMRFQLFKNDDFSFFLINVEMPPGTRLEATEKAMEDVEQYVMAKPREYVDSIVTRVGMIEEEGGVMNMGSHKGQVWVDLTEVDERPGISAQQILDDFRDHFPPIAGVSSVQFFVDQGGPPLGSPVTFRVMGEDYAALLAVSEEVQAYLRTRPGVLDIKDDFEWGKEEFRIDVDEKKAADLGLEVVDVAREVRSAFAGGLATTFVRGKEDVEIYVKFPESYRVSPQNIHLMKFRNKTGGLVPFGSVASVMYGQSYSVINRWNQKRAVTVTADVDEKNITSREINQELRERYGYTHKTDPKVTFDYGGEEKDSQESMAALGRAFALAMFVNYGIIATIFNSVLQPVVVMSVIPLSLVGVLIGLLIHDEPLGFMGLLGVVALVGIVVNNSILVVDFVNIARKRGWNRWRSLLWGAGSRVRPILLTTGTTIAGLFPMLFGLKGTSSFLMPLAISLVYGLAFATTLTLVVVPLLMAYLDDLKEHFGFRLVREEYDEKLLNQDFRLHPSAREG